MITPKIKKLLVLCILLFPFHTFPVIDANQELGVEVGDQFSLLLHKQEFDSAYKFDNSDVFLHEDDVGLTINYTISLLTLHEDGEGGVNLAVATNEDTPRTGSISRRLRLQPPIPGLGFGFASGPNHVQFVVFADWENYTASLPALIEEWGTQKGDSDIKYTIEQDEEIFTFSYEVDYSAISPHDHHIAAQSISYYKSSGIVRDILVWTDQEDFGRSEIYLTNTLYKSKVDEKPVLPLGVAVFLTTISLGILGLYVLVRKTR